MRAWSAVTIGVADMKQALAVWEGLFGMQRIADHQGGGGLTNSWSIAADDVRRQTLLATPGQSRGWVHLVEFDKPASPVREHAQAFDLVPKNLDVHVQDLPSKVAALKEQGVTFKTDSYATITAPNGAMFREIHMPSHDHTNIVLLEVVGEELDYSDQGYAAVGLLVTTTSDLTAEKQFYQRALGLDVISENQLAGPQIEQMIGLPAGASLNISILGEVGTHFGSMELVEYQGTDGKNLYPNARPKATGILMVHYQTDDLDSLESRWRHHALAFNRSPAATTLFGDGPRATLISPAGFSIQIHQTTP